MNRPHNCRHCTHMVCGDANWCGEHEECMSDTQISIARKCPDWEWNAIDALTMVEWMGRQTRKKPVSDGQMKLGFEVDG